MGVRSALCFELSRRLLPPPAKRTTDYREYQRWRMNSLSASWSSFSDAHVQGKDVLDFGCGDGALSLFLASEKQPSRVLGVDLNSAAIERARAELAIVRLPKDVSVAFEVGRETGVPVPDGSFDTLVAFDCLEHVMAPLTIFSEWRRVLRPGGRCLIEWFPFKGPWGPHMESLIPIPWAHVIFGQKALFRAAERIYDLPNFAARHWDLDEAGKRKPNKWRAWSSFKEQGYINELDLASFHSLVKQAGLRVARLDKRSFGGSPARRAIGRALMGLPLVGEYFMSYAVIELERPR